MSDIYDSFKEAYGAASSGGGSGHRKAGARMTGPIGVNARRHLTNGAGFTRVYFTPRPANPISKYKIRERISPHLIDSMTSYGVSATIEFPAGGEEGVLVTFFPKTKGMY